MSKPRVRFDAVGLADQCVRAGIDVAALPSGPDGWHTKASITAACRSQGLITMTASQPRRSSVTPMRQRGGPPAGPWGPDGDPVAWAYTAGKFAASRAPHWREQYRRDPEATARRLTELVPVPGLAGGNGYVHPVSSRFAPDPAAFVHPAVWASASARADEPPPRLFNSGPGDVPVLTASGIPADALHEIAWQARHPVAAEPDRGKAYQLLEKYSGADGETMATMDHGKSNVVAEYAAKVQAWAGKHADADAVYASLYGDEAAARAAAAEAADRARRREDLQRGLDRIDREET